MALSQFIIRDLIAKTVVFGKEFMQDVANDHEQGNSREAFEKIKEKTEAEINILLQERNQFVWNQIIDNTEIKFPPKKKSYVLEEGASSSHQDSLHQKHHIDYKTIYKKKIDELEEILLRVGEAEIIMSV